MDFVGTTDDSQGGPPGRNEGSRQVLGSPEKSRVCLPCTRVLWVRGRRMLGAVGGAGEPVLTRREVSMGLRQVAGQTRSGRGQGVCGGDSRSHCADHAGQDLGQVTL